MKLPVNLTQNISRNLLIFKKQSPHIFFVGGVVGTVVSTVLACRATLKLSSTLDNIQSDLHNVESMKENLSHSTDVSLYTETQYRKDITYVYTKAGVQIVKLYGPAVILSAASIAALTGSHVQLARRNAALMAAYAAMQKAYDDYRERVREQLGEERELDLYHAAKTDVVKNELGKNEEVKSVDPNKWSPYAKIFDESSKNWEKDPEFNRIFVQCQQNWLNQLLHVRGHVFLNEAYDALDIPRTKAGAVVGWVVGEEGDNFVDFGIFEAFNVDFVNGRERSIVLDFNVDGVIYDKI